MEELRKKVRQELKIRSAIDGSYTKPPTEHAVNTMIRNLQAVAGTGADNSPKHKKTVN